MNAQMYEDITSHVLTVNWSIGHDDDKEQISNSGTGLITLNNASKNFNPNNNQSPLYEKMLPNLRAGIRMYDPVLGNWKTMFTGVTEGYELVAGDIEERRVRINLVQPIFESINAEFKYPTLTTGAA